LLIQGVKDQKREVKVYNEGEACFLQAIKLSQQQNAKSLELRTAVSLSQLWQTRGRKAEAFGLLGNIYNRFEEGFGTPDLMAAKLLLEQLA
jgi:predicted ATPase